MICLVVGLDRDALTPWHENVRAVDITAAKQIALARAEANGVSLTVAAVIGPYSSVVSDPASERADRGAVRLDRQPSSLGSWDFQDAACGKVDVFTGDGAAALVAARLPRERHGRGLCGT